ncbi:MAG: NADH-ubiquinone oxidoreductase-F iron-sulfur binding region domain-containing protein [bacterium]
MNLIQKLKKSGLRGRGGASFPAWQKWEAVKSASSETKYVVCNLSEGEPGVFKDKYILENYLKILVEGIELAVKTVGAERAFIAIKDSYYDKFFSQIINHIGGQPIEIFRKAGGYISGEETALLEAIENRRVEPRIKPPYPVDEGLWRCPTLVNNAETLFDAALIAHGKYKNERLVSISGDCKNPGCFSFSENITIKKALENSRNLLEDDFFVQAGGGASGIVLNREQLECPLVGMGAIVVYDRKKTRLGDLALKWARFFRDESCGKCVPCREGTFRICEIFESKNPRWDLLLDIFENLKNSSFCAMGNFVPVPFESLIKNVLNKKQG